MTNHFYAGLKVAQKAKNGERLQMPSFHSSIRNRKEDEWIDQYSVQQDGMEYIIISKQILKGRRQLIKRKMEGRGVFVNVKKRKEEKEENYQEYCQRREQEEKVR